MATIYEILRKVRFALRYEIITAEDLEALIEIKKNSSFNPDAFFLTIKYRLPLEKMIKAGKYDDFNCNIKAKNFPRPRSPRITAKVTAKLFSFGKFCSSQEALDEMDAVGFRPATLFELLALGGTYPDLQKQFLIVALGSFWCSSNCHQNEERHMPYLSFNDLKRRLRLGSYKNSWPENIRFLGIKK